MTDRLQSLWIARKLLSNMGSLESFLSISVVIGLVWFAFMVLTPVAIVFGIINIVKLAKKVKAKK